MHIRFVVNLNPSNYFHRKYSTRSGLPRPVLKKMKEKKHTFVILYFVAFTLVFQGFINIWNLFSNFSEIALNHLMVYKFSLNAHLN